MKIFLIILLALVAFAGCGDQDDTWDIITISLPPAIKTSLAYANHVSGILRQTHRPLLEKGPNNGIYSDVLESWQRSSDSKVFSLCIKKGLMFNDHIEFRTADLLKSIQKAKRLFAFSSINSSHNCVDIKLEKPAPKFFDLLTSLEFAPTYESENTFELGLGAFAVTTLNTSEILLTRKQKSTDGFNYIRVTPLDQISSLKESSIEDFNQLPPENIPDWVRRNFNAYPLLTLKAYGLLLNIADPGIRHLIFNCIDTEKFIKAFYPKSEKMVRISSVLPMGIKGAAMGIVKQQCRPLANDYSKMSPLVFADWKGANSTELKEVFNDLKLRTGLKIAVESFSAKKLTDAMLSKSDSFSIAAISLDTENEEYLPFFEPFFDTQKKVHNLDVSKYQPDYLNLVKSAKNETPGDVVTVLNGTLIASAIYLPLMQTVRTFYFPKNISGISAGDDFLGSLDVSKIKR